MAGGSSAVDFARRFVREDHEAPRVVLNCQGVGVCGRNNVKRHDFISELESFFSRTIEFSSLTSFSQDKYLAASSKPFTKTSNLKLEGNF
jgi:hypothetical protein